MNERITRMLKNYRSYKYAVSNGIAPYQEEDNTGMPMAFSFGSRPPGRLSGRGSTFQSRMDYRAYKNAVLAIDGAVTEVLDDEEQKIIRYKYMERNPMTLAQIADKYHMSERRAVYLHKKALKALTMALTFVDEPEIINLDTTLKEKEKASSF